LGNLLLRGVPALQELARAGIDAAVKSEADVYQIYSSISGSIYDGSTPVQSVHFPTILQRLEQLLPPPPPAS
jgi:hypothetical protein